MNSRFRLSTKVWLLTAATGMIFCPTFASLGQTESRQDTSDTRRNYQQPSVVQRELDKLYKQDRRPVPKMTTKDALAALRNSRKAEQKSRADRTRTANLRFPEKTAWFDKFLPTGAKSRKQEVKKQEGIRPASAGVRVVGMTEQASNQRKTVSPITHTGQTVSHSISSSKSVTVVNKVALKAAVDSSPIQAVPSKAAAGKVATVCLEFFLVQAFFLPFESLIH